MTLEPSTKDKPAAKKKTKKARARELALAYKDLPEHEARKKIREEVPCSRSTASKALTWVKEQIKKEEAVRPSLEVVSEEEKKPEFIEKPEKPIKEIKPPEEIPPEEVKEQLEIFKDMLRGLHVLLVSEEGILGKKYGRPEKQCVQASDQLYRWLSRRYGVEDLERWDTILLILSYGTLAGGILKDVVAERRKKESKSKKSSGKP